MKPSLFEERIAEIKRAKEQELDLLCPPLQITSEMLQVFVDEVEQYCLDNLPLTSYNHLSIYLFKSDFVYAETVDGSRFPVLANQYMTDGPLKMPQFQEWATSTFASLVGTKFRDSTHGFKAFSRFYANCDAFFQACLDEWKIHHGNMEGGRFELYENNSLKGFLMNFAARE